MKNLEKILKENNPEKLWLLAEKIAEDKGYHKLDDRIYSKKDDYLMKMGRDLYYFEGIDKQEYQDLKEIVKFRSKSTTLTMIGYAMTMGGSAFGGALVGFCLLQSGFPGWIMLPSIVGPIASSLYGIFSHSTKTTKKERKHADLLDSYKGNKYMNSYAVKNLLVK